MQTGNRNDCVKPRNSKLSKYYRGTRIYRTKTWKNYEYFLQADGGILDRYKRYNGFENNTPIAFSDTDRGNTTEPDTEDINRDQSMNTIDSYFEYRVPIARNMQVGNHPFVTDVRENIKVNVPNGDEYTTRWIQFKVPIQKSYYEKLH